MYSVGTLSILTGPLFAIAKKSGAKEAAKAAGSKVAKKIVNENTSDIAQAFNNSKLLSRDAKDTAAKKWVRNLYENKEAMSRVAGRNLSEDEIKAVRNELPNAVTEKIKKYNEVVDKYKPIGRDGGKVLDEINFMNNYLPNTKRGYGDLRFFTRDELNTLAKNLAELPAYNKNTSFSHINVDRILKGIPKEKHNMVKDVLFDVIFEGAKGEVAPIPTAIATLKAADAGINKIGKANFQTNKELEIKPDYFARGSMPTPVSDFIASMFNVDFNDPARFNKKDIDTFFDFLEDAGYIEPGIKDKWTPRQKVSVMREILSDKTINERVKEKWAESKYKENLNEYYNNRGE